MKNYKAEIIRILEQNILTSDGYPNDERIKEVLPQILILFREIAKEGYIEIAKQLKDHAVAESDDIYFIKIQKKSLDEILSNIEKVIK